MNSFSEKLIGNVNKVIVGKDKQIELLLVSLLVGGHVLYRQTLQVSIISTVRQMNSYSARVLFSQISFLLTRSTVQPRGPSRAFSSAWRKSR